MEEEAAVCCPWVSPMPVYEYSGKIQDPGNDGPGREVCGTLEAPSRAAAIVRLRQQGVWITELHEQGARPKASARAAPARPPHKWSPFYGLWPVMPGTVASFFEQLSGLYRAGVSMHTVVTEVAPRVGNRRLHRILEEVAPRIADGQTLADCLEGYPQVFPAGVVGFIRTGELTGNVDEVARDLADEYYSEQRVWWWLAGPKLYFGFVLFMAALTPSFPRIVSHGFRWWLGHISQHVLPQVGALILLYLALKVFWHLPPLLRLRHFLAYYVPVWSALTRRVGLARFLRALQIAVRAGVDFPVAVSTAAQAAGNPLMVRQLQQAAERIRGGMPLQEALAACPFFSPSMLGMLSSAALGGTFDETLPRLAEQARASRDGLIKALRIGGFVLAYGLVAAVVVVAAVLGYLSLLEAQAERMGFQDLAGQ